MARENGGRIVLSITIPLLLLSLPLHAFSLPTHKEIVESGAGERVELGTIRGCDQRTRDHFMERLLLAMTEFDRGEVERMGRGLLHSSTLHDLAGFKELLMMNPVKRVEGFERFPPEGEHPILRTLLIATCQPDSDARNTDFFAIKGDGTPFIMEDGTPLPYHPDSLCFGKGEGLSSQALYHYGLPGGRKSKNLLTLLFRPEKFSLCPLLDTKGDDLFALYFLLSLWIKGGMDDVDGGEYLATLMRGWAYHYLVDTTCGFHNLYAGTWRHLFKLAFLYLRDLIGNLFGILGRPESFEKKGRRITKNLHIFGEELVSFVLEGRGGEEWEGFRHMMKGGLRDGDGDFRKEFAKRVGRGVPDFREVSNWMIHTTIPEAEELYDSILSIPSRRLFEPGFNYSTPDMTPFEHVGADAGEEELFPFFRTVSRLLARQREAVSLLEDFYWRYAGDETLLKGTPEGLLEGIVSITSDFHSEAHERRNGYL